MSAAEELTAAVSGVVGVLTKRRIAYFVTGSLAASAHAVFRATNDIDIVADFSGADLRDLIAAFDSDYFADPEQAVACVRDGQGFNLIHRTTFLKVDFFPAVSEFNHSALARAELLTVDTGFSMRVATREDILLAKLRWYRMGDEQSELQRRDIEGIVALNHDRLDRAYVGRWATELGVTDLLAKFLPSA